MVAVPGRAAGQAQAAVIPDRPGGGRGRVLLWVQGTEPREAVMRWMVVAALMLAPMAPMAAQAINKCEIDGRTIYQDAPCPEGAVAERWMSRDEQKAIESRSRRITGATGREQAALERLAERNRQATQRQQQRQQLPRLDVESRCRAVASVGGGYSASIFNGCMQREQAAYNGLGDLFSASPAGIRERCLQVATVGEGGSYSILQGCLERERAAASSTPGFRY